MPSTPYLDTISSRRSGGFAAKLILTVLIAGWVAFAIWKFALASPSMEGWLPDMASGIQTAEADAKPMLVLFTADWCPPCRQLKKDVLTDSQVAADLRDSFVLVKIDLTDRSSPNNSVAQDFGVTGIPALMAFDKHGQPIDTIVGGVPKSVFTQWIDTCKSRASGR